jgi:ABC-type cobalamin/Fe3+-siderophores transport system ATPase subunit
VIVGPSGCGKTNLLLNLLLKKGYLKFDRLHLYSKTLGQDKYQFLRDWAAALEAVAGKEVASFHSNSDDILPVESLDPNERAIMVFDDVMHEKQVPIEKYFTRGRHGGAD